jgi:small-conductance mechanosensitive channel
MTLDWLSFVLFQQGAYTLTVGHVLSATVVLFAGVFLSRITRNGVSRVATMGGNLSTSRVYTLNRFLHYTIMAISILVALSMLGIHTDKLLLLGGALGVGIGFGLQAIVNNFVSGVIILLEKAIKVGDFIELTEGLVGEVIEINIRSTMVRTNDNVDILVPNSEFISNRVTNWTLQEAIRRFRIPFGVAYGSDKELVKRAVLEAARSVPWTLQTDSREPVVWMVGFGDSSLNFLLGVWVEAAAVKRPTAMMSDYLWAIDDALRKNGIEIPFPQRDLHFRDGLSISDRAGGQKPSLTDT